MKPRTGPGIIGQTGNRPGSSLEGSIRPAPPPPQPAVQFSHELPTPTTLWELQQLLYRLQRQGVPVDTRLDYLDFAPDRHPTVLVVGNTRSGLAFTN